MDPSGPVRWLERYEAGGHARVWEEMRNLGGTIREPEIVEAALAVAEATMRRVRTNIERLADAWRSLGWLFDRSSPLVEQPDLAALIERFEREVGPVAISLRTFYE